MSNAVLIVIDVQNALSGPQSRLRNNEAFLDRISGLVARARAASVPVVFVQHDGGVGDELERLSEGWQINPGTGYRDGDAVVEKNDCDSFHNTNLQASLAELGATHLILTGMMTQYCVDTTCRRAFSLGYDVTLIGDGHATFDTDYLSAEQIVTHHNAIWSGTFATLCSAQDFEFSQSKVRA
ncbi:MAG: cysteine hydrolase [Proteobacteria bacterium]|nr:cysteine hydrolase [Pseudomonadota bacterium]